MNSHPSAFRFVPLLLLTLSLDAHAGDWSQWRGPNRNAISQEQGLLENWPDEGPPLAWKVEGLGGGYSSIAVHNQRIYTLGDFADGSYVIALDESDGSAVWKTRIGEAGGPSQVSRTAKHANDIKRPTLRAQPTCRPLMSRRVQR